MQESLGIHSFRGGNFAQMKSWRMMRRRRVRVGEGNRPHAVSAARDAGQKSTG
jgi:hypothetical protein